MLRRRTVLGFALHAMEIELDMVCFCFASGMGRLFFVRQGLVRELRRWA